MTRWYFVVDGQVGRDFSLLGPDDRPLTKRQLAEQIGNDAVKDRPVEHRTAVDARLFGLGGARFEQLLTLVLTLRRPQLAKNLDPKGLSRALADGLRPLDDSLIDEAAHSFGDMENVQRTLAGLVQADAAAGAFLAGYTTYLRTHARAACDAVAVRLDVVQDRRAALAGALAAARRAVATRDNARAQHAQALQDQQALSARLTSLKASPAYRDREQLGRLVEITGQLERATRRDVQSAVHAEEALARRSAELRTAEDGHRLALAAAARVAGNLIEAAQDAGIGWDTADNDNDGRLAERASARTAARDDDVAAIRAALAATAAAGRQRDQAQLVLDRAQERLGRARDDLRDAEAAVDIARERLTAAVDEWLGRHRETVALLATTKTDRPETAEHPHIADRLRTTLHEVVDLLGDPRHAGADGDVRRRHRRAPTGRPGRAGPAPHRVGRAARRDLRMANRAGHHRRPAGPGPATVRGPHRVARRSGRSAVLGGSRLRTGPAGVGGGRGGGRPAGREHVGCLGAGDHRPWCRCRWRGHQRPRRFRCAAGAVAARTATAGTDTSPTSWCRSRAPPCRSR